MILSLKNAKATFGENSNHYRDLKAMVDGAMRRLREKGEHDEVSKLMEKMSLV